MDLNVTPYVVLISDLMIDIITYLAILSNLS